MNTKQDNAITIKLFSIEKRHLYTFLVKQGKLARVTWSTDNKEHINIDQINNQLQDSIINQKNGSWLIQKDQLVLKFTYSNNGIITAIPQSPLVTTIDEQDQQEYYDLKKYIQLVMFLFHDIAYSRLETFNTAKM